MMAIRFSLATLLFMFIIGFSISDLTPTPSPNLVKKKPPSRLPPPPPPTPTHFEHFMMVQRWPKTFCQTKKCSKDIQPLPTEFVMHGLWPANRVISDPRDCLDKTNQKTIDIGNVGVFIFFVHCLSLFLYDLKINYLFCFIQSVSVGLEGRT